MKLYMQQHPTAQKSWLWRLVRSETAWLWVITGVAAVLRFYHLAQLPAALNRDEAAIGYNAWMLQTVGTDEWQQPWPLTLRSFGDYKLPGYPVVAIPSLYLFGVNDWSVRFPSALAGSLLPLAGWWLAKALGQSKATRVVFAAMLALSPFSLFYSRMAFEANLALTGLVGFLALLLQTIQKPSKPWWYYGLLSGGLLVLYATYNTPLLITPLLLGGLWIWWGKRQPITIFKVTIAILVPLFIAGWGLWNLNQQKSGITIFTDPTLTTHINTQYAQATNEWQKLTRHRFVRYGVLIGQHTLASFGSRFLVTQGGSHPWHSVPFASHLTWPLYMLGLGGMLSAVWHCWQKWPQPQPWQTTERLLSWQFWLLLAGLAPAVVTIDAPHATRSLLFLVIWVLFAAQGLVKLRSLTTFGKKSQYLGIGLALLVGWSSGWYITNYFTTYAAHQDLFQPGLSAALTKLDASKPTLVVGDAYTYIVLAWYLRLSPEEFLQTITRHPADTAGIIAGKSVANFTIRPDFLTPQATQSQKLWWHDHVWQTTPLP